MSFSLLHSSHWLRLLPRLLLGLLLAGAGAGRVAHAQVYYLDLSKQALSVPDRTVYIEQVLDGRAKRMGIGTVHRGMYNVLQQADLRPNVPQALTAWVQAQLPQRPTDHPTVLVVRQLAIAEEITPFYEKASLDLAVDIYAHLADGYHYIFSAAELAESKGLETTARHPGNLALTLQRCLAQCQRLDWANLPLQPARTLAELQQLGHAATPALMYAILTDSVHPKGYYPNFLAFRNNQPVAEPALSVETAPRTAKGWEGTLEVVPTLAATPGSGSSKEVLRKAWGFSDGQQLYILHNRRYMQLTRDGSVFRFVGFAGADPGAVSTAGYLAGPLGGAIAAAATMGKPADFTLDMVTGAVSPFSETSGAAVADTALIYVYRRNSTVPGPVRVLLNGKLVAELAEWQSTAIPWTDKLHEISLCLQDAPGRCTSFIPVFGRTAYVEVARTPTDAAKPALEQVAAKKGVFDLRIIQAHTKSAD